MAIGPVQRIVPGFNHPEFHGEIIAEPEKPRESDTVRRIDSLLAGIEGEEGMVTGADAVPLRDAVARAGGFRISDGFICPRDLIEMVPVSAEEPEKLPALETAADQGAR